MNQSEILKGKKILITGGSLGIGLAVAKECARAGAEMILASRTEADLKAALDDLNKISNAKHRIEVLDVSDPQQVAALAARLKGEIQNLDGLINCAGVYGPIGPIQELDMEAFKKAIEINFLGTVYMCRHFVPLLKEKQGKIVNFSGGGAATPFANYSAYATSKIAIVRFTENLAEELKDFKIAANVIAPGFVITRLHAETLKAGARAGAQFLEGTQKQIASGGVPPEKAARLTAYLLSSLSDGINGKFISAPWDPWETPEFANKLKASKNFATLRRIDDKGFKENSNV